MLHFVTRQVEQERLDFKECDLCGRRSGEYRWKTSSLEQVETKVHIQYGSWFAEGGYGEEYEADLCPECFDEKLIPWLKEQGCKREFTGWDY